MSVVDMGYQDVVLYRLRLGVLRPARSFSRRGNRLVHPVYADICPTCEWAKPVAKGECRACYTYRWRTGEKRPEEVITAHGLRVLESQR